MGEYGRLQHRFEALGGCSMEAEARRILAGLGFADSEVERDIEQFSGGWMMRVALARLLLQNPDVLLLDEPTNHLDLASVEWLQGFLADYAGAIVLVSHDRDFINTVANRVAELDHGMLTEYTGDYADFVEQRAARMVQIEAAAKAPGAQDRSHPGLHRPIQVQGQQGAAGAEPDQALDRVERIEIPAARSKSVKFRFPQPPRSGRDGHHPRDIVKGYGSTQVYDGLDLRSSVGRRWP